MVFCRRSDNLDRRAPRTLTAGRSNNCPGALAYRSCKRALDGSPQKAHQIGTTNSSGKNSRVCPSRRNQLSPPLRPKRFLRLAKGTASQCMTQLTWRSPAATNCHWERSMPTCARQHRQKAYRCCKAIRNTGIAWLALLVSSS